MTPGASSEFTSISVSLMGPNVMYSIDVLNNARGMYSYDVTIYTACIIFSVCIADIDVRTCTDHVYRYHITLISLCSDSVRLQLAWFGLFLLCSEQKHSRL